MQEDSFSAAERILSDIESVFLKDPKLKEFDILPITLNKNKSPVHHVENCLGLELWCVRHVYCYAYQRLFNMRQQKSRRPDPEVQARLLMGALLLNPDVQTFWNMRRELIQASRLDCKAELHFTTVVLSRKPKCAEVFSYRKWIATKLKTESEKDPTLLTRELEIGRAAANRYANNYHAWQHCIWSLTHLVPDDSYPNIYLEEWGSSKLWVSMHVSDHSGWQYRQYLLQQLCGPLNSKIPFNCVENFVKKYIHRERNILQENCKVQFQDTEGLRNRDKGCQYSLYENVSPSFKETDRINELQLNFVLSEIDLNTDLIIRYTGHEALWYHRRFLMSFLRSILARNKFCVHRGENCESNENSIISSSKLNSYLRSTSPLEVNESARESFSTNSVKEGSEEMLNLVAQALPRHEEQFLSSCVDGDVNQQRLSSHYHKWLVQVLGLSIVV